MYPPPLEDRIIHRGEVKYEWLPGILSYLQAWNVGIHPADLIGLSPGISTWRTPPTFGRFLNWFAVLYSNAILPANPIQYRLRAAQCGELINTHQQTVNINDNFVVNTYVCRDLVPSMGVIFPLIEAGDILNLRVNEAFGNQVWYVGSHVVYL